MMFRFCLEKVEIVDFRNLEVIIARLEKLNSQGK